MHSSNGNVFKNEGVTVVVPVLNESLNIRECLQSILDQDYPSIVEILIVDGGSTDDTLDIVYELQQIDGRIEILHNPRRIQASALNVALDVAKGSFLARVDGHCVLDPNYISTAVDTFSKCLASAVGGAINPVGKNWKGKGIAMAMKSKLGSGAASFHRPEEPQGYVDTVYMGVFDIEDLRKVGGYDEEFPVNEDAELAFRLGELNGIWYNPEIKSIYYPRETFKALGIQYFRYGRFRAKTVLKHPNSLSPRQLAAPVLIIALMSKRRKYVALAYMSLVGSRSLSEAIESPTGGIGFLFSVPIMHFCWGFGFLYGVVIESVLSILPGRRKLQ